MTSLVDGIPLAEAVRDAAEVVGQGPNAGQPFGLLAAGMAGAAVGTAAVDLAMDPVGGFMAAGLGWVIEHVPMLRDALNFVSGNPESIEQVTNTWTTRVATPLAGVAEQVHRAGQATADGWSGVDGIAYRAATTELAGSSEALAIAANRMSVGAQFAGSLVLEVRTFIRDELSKFLAWTLIQAAVATAAAAASLGSSMAAFMNVTLLRGAALAQRFAGVLRRLAAVMERFSNQLGALADAANALRRSAPVLGATTTAGRAGAAGATPARGVGAAVATAAQASPVSSLQDVAAAAGESTSKALGDAYAADVSDPERRDQ